VANTDDQGNAAAKPTRTRTSSTWVAVAVAVVFLVLLVDFIAQNDRKVSIHFLGASGHISLALALLAAAVAGAVVVLLISAARIVQLRVVGRRNKRAMRNLQQQAPPQPAAPQPVVPDRPPSAEGS
jgi:uncharacterized integral membrane protein